MKRTFFQMRHHSDVSIARLLFPATLGVLRIATTVHYACGASMLTWRPREIDVPIAGREWNRSA